ncbi:spore germination protein [Desulfitispora alkaliphila]|uniref:spore germination protein n=1 Tax=Desulfitispora alkaliphila TaxID=622674 RepID=UPI003D1EE72C
MKNSDLKLEQLTLGQRTKTKVCIAYMKGIANEQVVDEVKTRLERIEIDAILESGYIEEFIEDAPFSPFPTIGNTEKPDTLAAKILEGRVAIFVDGTPTVLSVPNIFVESLMASEDYYSRPYFASFIRIVRPDPSKD